MGKGISQRYRIIWGIYKGKEDSLVHNCLIVYMLLDFLKAHIANAAIITYHCLDFKILIIDIDLFIA